GAEGVVADHGHRAGGHRGATAAFGVNRRGGGHRQLAGFVVAVAGGVGVRVGGRGGQAGLVQPPRGGQPAGGQSGATAPVAVEGGHLGGGQCPGVGLDVGDGTFEIGLVDVAVLVPADDQRPVGLERAAVGGGTGGGAVDIEGHRAVGGVEHPDQVGPGTDGGCGGGLGAGDGRVVGVRGDLGEGPPVIGVVVLQVGPGVVNDVLRYRGFVVRRGGGQVDPGGHGEALRRVQHRPGRGDGAATAVEGGGPAGPGHTGRCGAGLLGTGGVQGLRAAGLVQL